MHGTTVKIAYHDISTVLEDLEMEFLRGWGNWTDENKRSLLCEREDGVVRTFDFVTVVRKRSTFFKFINDVIGHINDGCIFVHIKKRGFKETKIEPEVSSPTFDKTYSVFGFRQLQTAFYFLMLGYVLAVVCFVTKIIWCCFRSKKR